MHSAIQCYNDLDTLIDEVHGLFERWDTGDLLPSGVDLDTLQLVKLAVHEWLANLVQHADFAGHQPEVRVNITPHPEEVHCIIIDNSTGFDLYAQLGIREALLQPCPERGMGLLMLDACTRELSYAATTEGHFRLEFTVTADQDPWLNIPF